MEKGFEKIILQFTTDFENALLKKGGGGDTMLLNNPHFHLSYKKATIPQKKHSSPEILRAISHSECFIIALTVLCVNRLHNINAVLYSVSMFSLKAPFLRGVGGDQQTGYDIS